MVDAVATEDADATSTESTETTTTQTEANAELGDGGKKAIADERRARREAEKQLKATQDRLQKLEEANMNEVDRALKAAEDKGRSEGLREASIGRVEDAMRAAAGGRDIDIDALLDGLDRTKFLDDDGQPDRDAIQAWIDRVAPSETERGDGFQMPDLGQGARTPAPSLNGDPLLRDLKAKLGIR